MAGGPGSSDVAAQAQMLANRVRKTFKRLRGGFEQRSIGAFRLYDRDIPEVRALVDWYEGHAVVAEYAREQTAAGSWLEAMGTAVAEALCIPAAHVHLAGGRLDGSGETGLAAHQRRRPPRPRKPWWRSRQ